jgi:hypothetical protein
MPSPTRRAPRPAAPCFLAAAATCVALGACDARDARDAERAAVHDAARRAAALAAGDTASAGAGRDGAPGRNAGEHGARDHDAGEHDAGDHDAHGRDSQPRAGVRVGTGGARGLVRGDDPPLGPGDVRVTSTDGALVLAVIGDTVRVRLGDSVAARVRRGVGEGADGGSGFGGFVARTVKGAVGGAMAEATRFAVRVPVAEVRDLRYEDGELRFGSERRRRGRDSHTGARFAPADAERFIAAVRARQRALGVPEAGG